MFRFFFLILLLLILPDLFIWWNFTRLQTGLWRTALVWAPTVVTLLCLVIMLCGVRVGLFMQLAFVLLICVAVPKVVFLLFDALGWGVCWRAPKALPYVHGAATLLAIIVAAFQVYGTALGWHRLTVVPTTLRVTGLPTAFENYKIVQISDLHLGTYAGNTDYISRLVDSVNATRPDLIVFTGDLVNTQSSEADDYVPVLSRLKAKDGVLSILGNHDYCMYQPGLTPQAQAAETRRVVSLERSMGWHVLLNENTALVRGADTLYIAGVENVGKPPFPERGDLGRALAGIPADGCAILLSHDPWHWTHGVVGQNIPLTLSGHTHAMQLQIGRFSPASWFIPQWGGLYTEGRQQLYVSTGVGGTIPYRLGAWPRVEVLQLKGAGSKNQ